MTYMGYDFSTQSLKCVVINEKLDIVSEVTVNFDADLPEFKTTGGTHVLDSRVTAPPLMWVKALDMCLERLRDAGVVFKEVTAVSGDGQQHGSVWLKSGSVLAQGQLDHSRPLAELLKDDFSLPDSPIWMDSSTTVYCDEMTKQFGAEIGNITGSPATERYTGPQIAKIFRESPDVYNTTERICLVSNFAASLFLGGIAPIDLNDATGMNLLDIEKRVWHQGLLDFCAPDLSGRLGTPVSSTAVIGTIDQYFVDRYGFSQTCKVVAFTGDNFASAAGLALRGTDICLSMGTSDTVFFTTPTRSPAPCLQLACLGPEPVYMPLLCFKNGSLARDKLRESLQVCSWSEFSELLHQTPPGNNGAVAFYFYLPEIMPRNAMGVHRFRGNESTDYFTPPTEARAMIEGQVLSRLLHSKRLGLDKVERILVTGGASVNQDIIQIVADVFGASVYTIDCSNSAALGGAFRARHALLGGLFSDVTPGNELTAAATPRQQFKLVYEDLGKFYATLEAKLFGC